MSSPGQVSCWNSQAVHYFGSANFKLRLLCQQQKQNTLHAKCMLKEVLKHFDSELEVTSTHSTVFEDNNGAISLDTAPKMNARTKHIAVKYHQFWHHVSEGAVRIVKVDTTA